MAASRCTGGGLPIFQAYEYDVHDGLLQLPEELEGVRELNALAVVNDAVKGDLLQAVGYILSICDEPTDSQGGVWELQLPSFLPTGQVAQ